jgi:hypothetical protein
MDSPRRTFRDYPEQGRQLVWSPGSPEHHGFGFQRIMAIKRQNQHRRLALERRVYRAFGN